MKLYATTTSERATKGQGGNDFLDIQVNIFDKEKPTFDVFIKDIPEQGKTVFQVYQNTYFNNQVQKTKIIEKNIFYNI